MIFLLCLIGIKSCKIRSFKTAKGERFSLIKIRFPLHDPAVPLCSRVVYMSVKLCHRIKFGWGGGGGGVVGVILSKPKKNGQ